VAESQHRIAAAVIQCPYSCLCNWVCVFCVAGCVCVCVCVCARVHVAKVCAACVHAIAYVRTLVHLCTLSDL